MEIKHDYSSIPISKEKTLVIDEEPVIPDNEEDLSGLEWLED